MMPFTVTKLSRDSLGLRELLQRFAAEQWIPAHYTPEEAAAFVLDQFKRTVAVEVAGLEVQPVAEDLAR